MSIAWVFNLDADEELRHPEGHAPTGSLVRRMQRYVPVLAELARPGDRILPLPGPYLRCGAAEEKPVLQSRFVGQAWCPTPSALRHLRRAGALLPRFPPLSVLQRVNRRDFCAELGQTLVGARYVRSFSELQEHVSRFTFATWLLKQPFGFAGRGHRRVTFTHLDEADRRWIDTSLRHEGGLQAEPWVQRLGDFALHGYIEPTGMTRFGRPTVQECSRSGAWIRTRAAGTADLTVEEEKRLKDVATASAGALYRAGYFGPFGLDAYRWRDAEGRSQFNPRSEINARYSMGWHVGMGTWRPSFELGGA